MQIRLMDYKLRNGLLFILFGTNNWDIISRFTILYQNANVRLIEYKFQNYYSNDLYTDQYKLYRYAKEITESNIVQLQNVSPDVNLFYLDQVKRNTRSCIEAYINMICLLNEPLFINLYNRECKTTYSEDLFKIFLNKYNLSENDVLYYDKKQQKYTYVQSNAKFKFIKKIHKINNWDITKTEELIQLYKLYNNYSHSNIYANKNDDPEADSKYLLETNLYILKQVLSYFLQWIAIDNNGEYERMWKTEIDDLYLQIEVVNDFLRENRVLLHTEIPPYITPVNQQINR